MQIKFNCNNFIFHRVSATAWQRHTPSPLAAVIGLSNNDVIPLRSLRWFGCKPRLTSLVISGSVSILITSALCHSAQVDRSALTTQRCRSSAFCCWGSVDLELAAWQPSWPRAESQHFQTSTEDILFTRYWRQNVYTKPIIICLSMRQACVNLHYANYRLVLIQCSSLCRMPVVALLRAYIIFTFWTLRTLFYVT